MKKKGFTLMEIMVVVVIVGVLAVLGFYASQSFFENAKDRTCRANLMVLKHALDFYILDHEVFPAALAEIPQKYIDRAYASMLPDDHSWQVKLSSFIEGFKKVSLVYAQPFINTLSPRDLEMVSCPKDLTPPTLNNFDVSYGINVALRNQPVGQYQALGDATLLIGDCEAATFAGVNNLARRHGDPASYALAIRKDGQVVEQ
jgi:prepilin-type N-terminal cleavage/methylation domain-containing protein